MPVLPVPVTSGATSEQVRRHNLAGLLSVVHAEGATSRAALTARTGLNRSTIRALVGELAEAGLVSDRPQADPAGPGSPARAAGRPSHLVVPQAERVQVFALDVDVSRVEVARVGLSGTVLDRTRITRADDEPAGATLAAAAQGVRELAAASEPGAVTVGVGVAVPGLVSRNDGCVRVAPNLGWLDQPVSSALQQALGLPVAVGNDADLAVLAEHVRGVAVGQGDVVYLTSRVGLGGGVLVGGVPLGGAGGYAGELGHMRVNPAGRRCRCGARGCWETEVGEDALLRAAGWPPGGGLPAVRQVLAAAQAGDRRARSVLADLAGWIGLGVGLVVNVFNPRVLIFSGALGEVYPHLVDQVDEHLSRSSLRAARAQVQLALPGLGADSALLGAAELAFAPLLSDPMATLARLS